MRRAKSPDVQRAEEIVRGRSESPGAILELAERLKNEKAFSLARRILERAREHRDARPGWAPFVTLLQRLAFCTYMDPDLPKEPRLDRALAILEVLLDVRPEISQETRGLLGAIHKRKWEVDGRTEHLTSALEHYREGYRLGIAADFGYTAVNAAFVDDLLAEQRDPEDPTGVELRRAARELREQVIAIVPGLAERDGQGGLAGQWWFAVTIAEAYFGLARWSQARPWLQRALQVKNVSEWEYETTARQLATLARFHAGAATPAELRTTEAWRVLEEFLGDNAAGVLTAFIGKVGLALSGGGFRASLFHIGVLARLAEADVLRHVEVLSCVSGGSIIGAHYYLEVRRLLQTKGDGAVTREDYLEIVERVAREFVAGVQRNVRARVMANPLPNLRTIFSTRYSRTLRAGEVIERQLFSRVPDDEGRGKRWLNKLHVEPHGEPPGFTPKTNNWRRASKVPILILNATTLNTGHVWQFTASWMGEPPIGAQSEVDGNPRLRRLYYDDAPPHHQAIRLGHAVAASACVPGLFEPVVLDRLYGSYSVRLVDGGVHDNQGIAGLLEQECSVLIVSDASGQMQSLPDPGAGLLAVPLRANAILQARVREAQYHQLVARLRSSLLRALILVHLRSDLDEQPVDPIGCRDPHAASNGARRPDLLTRYGIRKDVQRLLSGIRTDLDSFSDLEAFALMTSGYRMIDQELKDRAYAFATAPPTPHRWRFLDVEPLLTGANEDQTLQADLERHLEVGALAGFKAWRLSRSLRWLARSLGVVALLLLVGLVAATWGCALYLPVPLLAVGAGAWVIKRLLGVARLGDNVARVVTGIGLCFGGIPFGTHLLIFNRFFLRLGRDRRFFRGADS
jgi:predicted acylesterase/phospholipase RssA